MLTGPLLRVSVRGPTIRPSFLDCTKKATLQRAEQLIACFENVGSSRAELDEQIDELAGNGRDHKVVRGLAKVLFDASDFDSGDPICAPDELRRKVFALAQARGPLALEAGPLGRVTAQTILDEVALEYGVSADRVSQSLYADLRENHRLMSCKWTDPTVLIQRYNVSLVQAILLKATALRIAIRSPSTARLRQLFRYLKFYQLLHQAERVGDELHLRIDGPSSLFSKTQRYGMQLAQFFPALLLQSSWTLSAEVIWTKARHKKQLELSSKGGMRSHYRDTGAYDTREQTWFAERFDALESGWTRESGQLPISLGPKAVILPDFVFSDGARVASLEIIGFWRRSYLQGRVDALARYGRTNHILAVSKKLKGGREALADFPGEVIVFSEIIPAKKVLAAIERVAIRERG